MSQQQQQEDTGAFVEARLRGLKIYYSGPWLMQRRLLQRRLLQIVDVA